MVEAKGASVGMTTARLGNRIRYRARQFWRALGAGLDRDAPLEAAKWLELKELNLFLEMSAVGRRHGADVARTLLAWGHRERSIMAAALLHDVGKDMGGRVPLPHRVATALLAAFWPQALAWMAQRPWGKGFRPHFTHPELGAWLAEEAGSNPLTVELIRHHHEPPGSEADPLRLALWQADNEN